MRMKSTIIVIVVIGIIIICLWALSHKCINSKTNEISTDITSSIQLRDKDSTINIVIGESLSYSHKVHGSVGYWYNEEYDPNAFEMDCFTKYDNPESIAAGECGGDSAIKTCVFKALKSGIYTITIIHEFRGTQEKVITYKVIVK